MKFATTAGMPNPVLEQFTHSITSIVIPVVIVCGILGIVLGELRKWVERRATRLGAAVKKTRALRAMAADASIAPHCPNCNAVMERRTAKRGVNAGSQFWGCPSYPRCHGTRDI